MVHASLTRVEWTSDMSVPPRWRNCPRKGKIIANKFLPFKVPLSAEYDRELNEEHRFHVPMLISFVEGAQQRMGLVVDLTKTDRYYDKRDLLEHNIGYHKILCEGFGAAPSKEQVSEFIQITKHFFTSYPGQIVGIHCTHGFNRTGFLIAAYLVEEECWDLEAAVSTFSTARPPGIYKAHYLQELVARYGGAGEELLAPALPAWCLEEAEGESGEEEGGRGASEGRKRRELNNEQAKFAVNVSGVDLVLSPVREEIQQTCQHALSWSKAGFPGSQPVSMDVQNIELLNKKPYRVSWKADGTRYMLYIKGRGAVYLIDRDNSVFSAPMFLFPARKKPDDHLMDTLIDSELVKDSVQGGGMRPRLLLYDIMRFNGSRDISQCDHMRRMTCIRKEIIEPREKLASDGLLDKTKEPFSIREKTFWDVAESKMILDRFIPNLTHESDGLIFNPTAEAYVAGECRELLKWKPEELNSVDFRLNIVRENKPGELPRTVGQLFVGGFNAPMSELDLSLNREAMKYSGRIIECHWDYQHNKWKFMRLREDKSFPNSYNTALKVCQSIRQPVTKNWLLEVVEKYRWQLKQAPPTAPPPVALGKRPATDADHMKMPPPKLKPHNY